MKNLEMSGNLTAVREVSGILLKLREVAGKNLVNGLKLFIVSWMFASILDFAELVHFGFGSCTVAFLPPVIIIIIIECHSNIIVDRLQGCGQ